MVERREPRVVFVYATLVASFNPGNRAAELGDPWVSHPAVGIRPGTVRVLERFACFRHRTKRVKNTVTHCHLCPLSEVPVVALSSPYHATRQKTTPPAVGLFLVVLRCRLLGDPPMRRASLSPPRGARGGGG